MYKITKLPKSQIEILFEISADEFKSYCDKALLLLAKNLKMPGFRDGKVPKEIAEKELGIERITAEAAEIAAKESYEKAVSESNVSPIGQAQTEIRKLALGSPFEFKILASVLPEVNLPGYKKIAGEIKRKEIAVSESEIKDSLSWLQKSRAKFSLKSGPAEKGDFVEIEYSSPQLEGGKKYQDAFLLGDGRFLPDFENNFEGMKDGGEKEFSFQFPADYGSSFAGASADKQKDLAGKNINFKIKMKSVQKAEFPEINGEFIKTLGNFDNLQALEKSIKDGILAEKNAAESQKVRAEILEKISQSSACEIPDILVEMEKNNMLHNLEHRVLEGLKITFEEYLSKIKKSEKEMLDSFSLQAEKRVKESLVLGQICKKENIEVSEEEIKEETDKILKQYPDIKTAEKSFDRERFKSYAKEVMKNEKTLKLLESFTRN